jgi:hypothetical protein
MSSKISDVSCHPNGKIVIKYEDKSKREYRPNMSTDVITQATDPLTFSCMVLATAIVELSERLSCLERLEGARRENEAP